MVIAIPHQHARSQTLRRATTAGSSACVAGAYDHVGDDYGRYADGDGAEDVGEAANRVASDLGGHRSAPSIQWLPPNVVDQPLLA